MYIYLTSLVGMSNIFTFIDYDIVSGSITVDVEV